MNQKRMGKEFTIFPWMLLRTEVWMQPRFLVKKENFCRASKKSSTTITIGLNTRKLIQTSLSLKGTEHSISLFISALFSSKFQLFKRIQFNETSQKKGFNKNGFFFFVVEDFLLSWSSFCLRHLLEEMSKKNIKKTPIKAWNFHLFSGDGCLKFNIWA